MTRTQIATLKQHELRIALMARHLGQRLTPGQIRILEKFEEQLEQDRKYVNAMEKAQ